MYGNGKREAGGKAGSEEQSDLFSTATTKRRGMLSEAKKAKDACCTLL